MKAKAFMLIILLFLSFMSANVLTVHNLAPTTSPTTSQTLEPTTSQNVSETSATYISRQDWTNAWTLDKAYSNGTHVSTFYSAPQVLWNGSQWVNYIYQKCGDYYLLRNSFITAEVYNYYAKFYDANYTEVRLQDEQWEVQKLNATTQQWEDANVQSETPTFSVIANDSGVWLTKSFTSSAGIFNITYVLRTACPLEHLITWKSFLSNKTQFRILQEWSGISGNSLQCAQGVENVTTSTTVNSTWFSFMNSDNFSIYEDSGPAVQPTTINASAEGMNADFTYANSSYTIPQYGIIKLDPMTFTSECALDGEIDYIQEFEGTTFQSSFYNVYVGPTGDIQVGAYSSTSGSLTKLVTSHGYFSFPTSSIPHGALVTSAQLNLTTYYYQHILKNFPLYIAIADYGSSLGVQSWDSDVSRVTDYWVLNNYPGNNQWILFDLGTKVYRVNKLGNTQFELTLDSTRVSYGGGDILFYSCCNPGKEPMLNVVWHELPSGQPRAWALIICGADSSMPGYHDCLYMYQILCNQYNFNYILYLDVNNNSYADDVANLQNTRYAITNWLKCIASSNDLIFIYSVSHGGGYCTNAYPSDNIPAQSLVGGIYDANNTEGPMVLESDIKYVLNPTCGMTGGEFINVSEFGYDLKDGVPRPSASAPNNWVGVEGTVGIQVSFPMVSEPIPNPIGNYGYSGEWQYYTNDQLASDINTLTYSKLIFVRTGGGCFSGALIHLLSAPNRIIMTDTNETGPGFPDWTTNLDAWSENFENALSGHIAYWNNITNSIAYSGSCNADTNGDGRVSMLEAWNYAWNNDGARLAGLETPWFDDDGSGLPHFVGNHDIMDTNPANGQLSANTFLPKYDICITNVVVSANQVCRGSAVNITVTIRNQGTFTETFQVEACYGSNQIGTTTVSNLAPGTSTTAIITWNTANVPSGTYTISATALVSNTNTSDNTYTGGTIRIFAPIFVSITNPLNGQKVNGIVKITASASDADGVKQVQFYVDGNLIETASATSNGFYQCLWNITKEASSDTSRHTIEFVAYNSYFDQNTSQITVWLDRHDVVITGTQYLITRPGTQSENPYEMEGWSAGAVYPDWGPLHAYVTVQNEGSYNESFTVVADPDNSSFYHSVFGIQNCTLAPDQNVTLDFVLNNFTGMPPGQSYMFAYWITGVPNETSAIKPFWLTSVNYLYIDWGTVITVRLPGDCNGDGIINMADLNIVKAALNSTFAGANPFGPGYDWRADFLGTGTVTMADYNIVMAALSPGTQGPQD
jgi:hypothetical protein